MQQGTLPPNPNKAIDYTKKQLAEIVVAGGCFWGTEAYMARIPGVFDTDVAYVNGHEGLTQVTYREVCSHTTGFAEAVRLEYAPEILSLGELLEHYFSIIDPTSLNRQGNDIGDQYRTGIYYKNKEDLPVILEKLAELQKKHDRPLRIEVEPLRTYVRAEEYHQDYLEKNPEGYCHVSLNGLNAVHEKFKQEQR